MLTSNSTLSFSFSKVSFEGVYDAGSVKVVGIDKQERKGLVDGNIIALVKTNAVADKHIENEDAVNQAIAAMIRDINDQPDVAGHRFGVITLKDGGQMMIPSPTQPDLWMVMLAYYGDAIDEPIEQFRYGWWLDLVPAAQYVQR